MRILLFVILPVILLTSCGNDELKEPIDNNGKFLSEVIPLEDFNSEFDDYNSNIAYNRFGLATLMFSSKREKKNLFSMVYFQAQFNYDNDRLSFTKADQIPWATDYFGYYNASDFLASLANGNFNTLGPKTVSFQKDFMFFDNTRRDLALFYADDSAGNLDIKYIEDAGQRLPVKFDLLNSDKDEAYPSFSFAGDKIYFCSNRDGNFDIYEVSIPRTENEKVTLESLVNPKAYTLKKLEELSSPYDDKCPYIYLNKMVFVSNRPGGKGGYDIYSSTFKDGKWSEPINAGERINTIYDEYRPILPSLANFSYFPMIFSSNRPGGKGGFDLYMTGLDGNKYN